MFLITFQNNNNYGAFLQMFALQKKLGLANMKVFDYRPSCISLHSLYLSNKIKKGSLFLAYYCVRMLFS